MEYTLSPTSERPINGGLIKFTNTEDVSDTYQITITGSPSPLTVTVPAGALTLGVPHDVTITLTNSAGQRVVIDEPDVTAVDIPSAPGGITSELTSTEGEVRLDWSQVSSTSSRPVSGYRVFVYDSSVDSFVQAYQGVATNATIGDLDLGVMARFMVASYGSAGEGSRSSEVQETPIGMPAEADVTSEVLGDLSAFVNVEFASVLARPVSTLVVTATAAGHSTVTRTVSIAEPDITLEYAPGGLDEDTTYSFGYTLTNAFGTSTFSAGTLYVPFGEPSAPTISSSLAGNGTIGLNFTAPSSNGGTAITGYVATCTDPNGVDTVVNGSSSPINFSGLTNEVLYSCVVQAKSSVGTGAESNVKTERPTTATYLPFTGNYNGSASQDPLNGLFYHIGTTQGSASWANPVPSLVTATSSSSAGINRAVYSDRAFGGVWGSTATTSHHVTFALPSGISMRPTTYTFMGYSTSMGKSWTYQASNDNSTWTTIDSQTNNTCSQGYPSWSCVIDVSSSESYQYHRVVWTGSSIRLYLSEIEFYGYYTSDPAPAAPTGVTVTQMAKDAVKVAYAAPASGSTPTSYTVTCTGSDGATTRSVTVSGTETYLGNLTELGQYSCAVRASNFAGGTTSSSQSITLGTSGTLALLYASKRDSNGLMYYLGTNGRTSTFANPCTSGAIGVTTTAGLTSNKCANMDRYFAGVISSKTSSDHALNILLSSGTALVPTGYTVTGLDSANAMDDWSFQGSNDLANWTTLDSETNATSLSATKSYALPIGSTSYRYFRLYFTADGERNRMYTNEIEIYGFYTPSS